MVEPSNTCTIHLLCKYVNIIVSKEDGPVKVQRRASLGREVLFCASLICNVGGKVYVFCLYGIV